MVKRPVISNIILLNTLLSYGIISAGLFFLARDNEFDWFFFWVTTVFLSISSICSIIKYFCKTAGKERAALAVQLAASFFILPNITGYFLWELLFLTTIILETAVYEEFPISIILSLSFLIIELGYSILASGVMNQMHSFETTATLLFVEAVIIFSVTGMIYYREQLVYEKHEIQEITEVMKRLTKTNLEYQDYAVVAEETATEQERNRITRDIHDIVGYTLTNTIMMMEAAIDMMQRNPLGVASLINTTRENAQEGLEETRRALYKLREKHKERPKGMVSVIRMINLFTTATKVKVDILWNDLNWDYDEIRNYIIFHCIQQGLINAFIHGKASKVIIHGTEKQGMLVLSINDNGVGCGETPITEGIGLKGLRERLEKIGGSYEIGTPVNGFLLTAAIPLEQQKTTEKGDAFEREL